MASLKNAVVRLRNLQQKNQTGFMLAIVSDDLLKHFIWLHISRKTSSQKLGSDSDYCVPITSTPHHFKSAGVLDFDNGNLGGVEVAYLVILL